jgi:pullulanase/glycogen debranching enzyme
VLLDNTYVNPVVLCSVQYLHNTNLLLVRISNITTTSFDLRLEDPVGGAVAVDSVSYLVAEEGAWEVIP